MNRRRMLQGLAAAILVGCTKKKERTMRMPVLFLGHGSPMNAIETNDFTKTLAALGQALPRPTAILCVSAHWLTEGTFVTAMAKPRTIHDFGGFPQALFDVQYPAPGDPETAALVRETVHAQPDAEKWGLDHGAWSVLKHVFPRADVPVLQLSVAIREAGPYHVQLGEQLRALRERGVLIVGSGNIVHNLRRLNWETHAPAFSWAEEFDAWAKAKLDARDTNALATQWAQSEAGRLSVPTPDHYYPLLTVAGAADAKDTLSYEFEGIHNASISMRAVAFGLRR